MDRGGVHEIFEQDGLGEGAEGGGGCGARDGNFAADGSGDAIENFDAAFADTAIAFAPARLRFRMADGVQLEFQRK